MCTEHVSNKHRPLGMQGSRTSIPDRRRQSFVMSLSIHPFGCACTMTPGGNLAPFGSINHLKMMTGFSLIPFAMHVERFFSWPIVRTITVLTPIWLAILLPGKSNVMGVSSMLPIWPQVIGILFATVITTQLHSLSRLGVSARSLCAGEGTGRTDS